MASATEPHSAPIAPIPPSRMSEIVIEACDATFASVSSYSHPQTSGWNTSIINKTLQSLLAAVSIPDQPPQYKFAVTSTIIQHTTPTPQLQDSSIGTSGSLLQPTELSPTDAVTPPPSSSQNPPPQAHIARRGMHCATGAFWDNDKDGMWSFKYEKGETKGFDVVINVVWIKVV